MLVHIHKACFITSMISMRSSMYHTFLPYFYKSLLFEYQSIPTFYRYSLQRPPNILFAQLIRSDCMRITNELVSMLLSPGSKYTAHCALLCKMNRPVISYRRESTNLIWHIWNVDEYDYSSNRLAPRLQPATPYLPFCANILFTNSAGVASVSGSNCTNNALSNVLFLEKNIISCSVHRSYIYIQFTFPTRK